MRNIKRYLAAASAASLLFSSTTVFADPLSSGDITGNGVVEVDNSTAPTYNHVVLPTVANNTYDFKLDPSGLLNRYDPENYPNPGGGVYFLSQSAPASLAHKTTGTKIYCKEKQAAAATASDSVDALKAKLTAASGNISTITGDFYLWTPSATEGEGEYTQITTTNIGDYFDIEIDTDDTTIKTFAMKANHLSGTNVCDDMVYTDAYKEITTADDPEDYVDVSSAGGTVTVSLKAAVTLYSSTDATNYTAISDVSDLVYTAAAAKYQDKSDSVKIVNKSTSNATVTATVTVSNPGTLNFVDDDTFEDSTDTDVYIAIVGDDSSTEVVSVTDEVASASATFSLNKGGNDSITYRTGAIDENTGGSVYAQYEKANPHYEDVSFYISAKANMAEGVEWGDYADTVTASTRPTLKVVYGITFEDDEPEEPEEPEETDDYVIQINANGTASYTFVDAPDTDGTGITALDAGGSSRMGAVSSSVVTYDSTTGTITFGTNAVTNWLAAASTVTATINGDDFTFTVNDPYVITVSGTTASYTFDSAPSGELTALSDNVKARTGAIDVSVTYDEETGVLEFAELAVTNWLKDSTYVDVTIGTSSYHLRVAH